MNLAQQPPRRPSNLSILGIANLARMADKARAARNETQGEYIYGLESGFDETLLDFLGISEEDFADAADRYGDAELGQWVQKVFAKTEADIRLFNQSLLNREPKTEGAIERLNARIEKYAPGRTDIQTTVQSIELEDWGLFREVDLTKRPPRTPYCRDVAGLYAAARMADKARAAKIDKLNGYIYNCPIDQVLLSFLGISVGDFQEAAWTNPNDIELGDWMRAHTLRTQAEMLHFNYQISHKGPDDDRGRAIFKETLDRVAPERTDVVTWFDLLDLDDEHDYGLVDLTRHAPRSPYNAEAMGLNGLARLIDKGRAALGNSLGRYYFGDDSPVDRSILAFLGLSTDTFKTALKKHPAEADLVAWIKTHTGKTEADIAAFNAEFLSRGPQGDAQTTWFRNVAHSLDSDRTDITTFAALMHLDDLMTYTCLKAGV